MTSGCDTNASQFSTPRAPVFQQLYDSPSGVDHRDTEEATKSALVLPFIQMLGYEIFDPTEVVPEYTADVGTKKGENVDYALMQNGKPAVLVECKKYVSPIILTKGLEFDAVIVANARKDNFNETDFDRKLLYLACTRARHQLEDTLVWHPLVYCPRRSTANAIAQRNLFDEDIILN